MRNKPTFAIVMVLLIVARCLLNYNMQLTLIVGLINLFSLLTVVVSITEQFKMEFINKMKSYSMLEDIKMREQKKILRTAGCAVYIPLIVLFIIYLIFFVSDLGNDIISILALGLSLSDIYIIKSNLFTTNINMNNMLGTLEIYIKIHKNSYVVYVVLNSKIEEPFYDKIAEYLHRANYGMRNGNFEMDYTDGEIRYKTFVGFEGIKLSAKIVERSILVPIFMFEKYGINLYRIILDDDDPKQLIENVEEE